MDSKENLFSFSVPSNKRRSFFIRCRSPTEEDISLGFRWFLENAEGKQKGSFLAVPSLISLREGTILSVLGEPAVRALETNGRMNFNRIFLRLITNDNTIALQNADSSVVLALYSNPALLKILDSNPGISSILAVPEDFSEIKEWVLKWKAVDLETSKPLI